ncbi:MAG: adenylate/guanylate cyclase domain-containing protein [Candidatus Omnitrophica bacterium]|nr:adenylate/guanylate cyclase domain-containing protein [Candidatus Omnitrophota bacterium]
MIYLIDIIRRFINWTIATAMALGIFAGCRSAINYIFPGNPHNDATAMGLAAALIAIALPTLWYHIKNLVDRALFPEAYQQMKKLHELADQIPNCADREELSNKLFSNLQSIGFGNVGLLLKDVCTGTFRIRKFSGQNSVNADFSIGFDSPLINILEREKRGLLRKHVSILGLSDADLKRVADEMDALHAEICFPLRSPDPAKGVFGIVVLGNSKLGQVGYWWARNRFWLTGLINNVALTLERIYHQELNQAFAGYMGLGWAREMLHDQEGFQRRLCSRRTWVSVAIVDIRHFTKMCAHMDAAEVVSLLKEFRTTLVPLIIQEYKGSIDKFMGDAIMINFGTPISRLENPDEMAVRCGLAILECVEKINRGRANRGKQTYSVGIGISSGDVIAGNVESGEKLEYTVIGDAVNLVARLESMAEENQILISPETFERVKNIVVAKARKPKMIEGFDNPITVYELKGINQKHRGRENETEGQWRPAANQ